MGRRGMTVYSGIRVRFLRPRESLRPFITCLWSWEGEDTQTLPRLLPEPAAELLLYHGEPFRCSSPAYDYGIVPRIHFVGFRDCYFDIHSTGPVGFLAVRFKPTGLASFLGCHPGEWTGDFPSAGELWSGDGRALEEAFSLADTLPQRVRIVEDFLESRLSRHFTARPQWDRILSGMNAALQDQDYRVDRIARSIGTTTRSLQRLFDRHLGLSPKMFLRLKRFERLLMASFADPQGHYLQHGQDLGYYDQSHIIRDFEEFAGQTPMDFLQNRGYLSLFYNTTS